MDVNPLGPVHDQLVTVVVADPVRFKVPPSHTGLLLPAVTVIEPPAIAIDVSIWAPGTEIGNPAIRESEPLGAIFIPEMVLG